MLIDTLISLVSIYYENKHTGTLLDWRLSCLSHSKEKLAYVMELDGLQNKSSLTLINSINKL